jgi:hypothetical protein
MFQSFGHQCQEFHSAHKKVLQKSSSRDPLELKNCMGVNSAAVVEVFDEYISVVSLCWKFGVRHDAFLSL